MNVKGNHSKHSQVHLILLYPGLSFPHNLKMATRPAMSKIFGVYSRNVYRIPTLAQNRLTCRWFSSKKLKPAKDDTDKSILEEKIRKKEEVQKKADVPLGMRMYPHILFPLLKQSVLVKHMFHSECVPTNSFSIVQSTGFGGEFQFLTTDGLSLCLFGWFLRSQSRWYIKTILQARRHC